MATDDREQQFERALARLLRDASPDSQCPDAETLSAYHERTLPLDQMTLWKEHISGCVLCQEILALVEQSENVHTEEWEENEVPVAEYEEMAAVPLRAAAPKSSAAQSVHGQAVPVEAARLPRTGSRERWRWIVPIGAVAAAAMAWVGVHEIEMRNRSAVATVQTAQNLKTEPELSAPATSLTNQLTDQGRKEVLPSATLNEVVREKKIAPVSPKAVPRAIVPAADAAASGAAGGVVGGVPGGVAVSSNEAAKLPTLRREYSQLVVPPPPATSSANTLKGRDAEKAAPAPPSPSPAAPAGARISTANAPTPEQKQLQKQQEEMPRCVAESVTVQAQNETVEVQSAPADAISAKAISNLPVQGENFQNLMRLAAADQRYIVAPGGKYAWRVGEAGKIERSDDHGRTWKPQQSGVATDLTAGSATSDKICWIVGKAGAVLRTTDGGKHWKRMSSPALEDLGGIQATDVAHASIWDISKHVTFETADGGVTWQQVPRN